MISGALIAILFSVLIGAATGLPAFGIFAAIAALSFFATSKEKFAFFTALDITEIAEALGDYYRENRDILVSEMLLDPNADEMFEVYDDVTDELPLPNLSIGNIIKPGLDPTFQATPDAIKFGSRILKVRDVKYDLLLTPKVLHKLYLSYKRKQRRADGSHDPMEIIFEAEIMAYIQKAARNQLYEQAMYKGVYNAAGTTPGSTMTGFASLVTQLIAAEAATAGTGITPVSVAAITSTNVIDVFEAVYDGLGEAYKTMDTHLKVEPTYFDYYVRRYRSLHGGNNDYSGMAVAKVRLDGSKCDIVRDPGLTGTGRIICSPKENFVYGCDAAKPAAMIIQPFDRNIKIMGDFKAGTEFAEIHSRALSVNELASDGLA